MLTDMMLALQRKGCHNINLVSPGHIIPQIVEAIYIAANRGLQIPIVYNSNGYDLTDSLRLLKDIIDIYLPDLKFADDEKAYRYMGVKHYYTIAKEALREMHDQVGGLRTDDNNVAYRGLMIRHLVLPENLADTDKIMDFIVQELGPDTYVNIMPQYYPAHQAYNYPELSRSITKKEYQQAVSAAKAAGLKGLVHSL
ncbi:putative pyruvate formate lyase activating enzyme [Geosporobacter subterraneus DSM 17957]|uniref:Putative pyruvate formate lyase activating enzyme n=1 Tax=Geosporobacter subterraneus DSM 17957 TaxID=1121919 RepID=A0A1M6FT68_9FIRM|nr:hypothetical protein [Geosporobacter subterraneus]SHJ00850.1 putative pyruvate formate lyase activating enzyme [Geosporobacter subterraneus DSM 17957]